jgi:hypothetical protein
MRIILEVIPHSKQRLPNSLGGDWQWEGEDLTVRVSDTGNWRMNFLFARHEMDEAVLCRHNNITTEMVDYDDKFGTPFDDPDSFSGYANCIYQTQHNDALAAEWVMSRLLNVDWKEYGEKLESLGDQNGNEAAFRR